MSLNAVELRAIAETSRTDFESGAISVDHVLEVGRLYLPAGAIDMYGAEVPAILTYFPSMACDLASAVLRHRVGYGEVSEGSYEGLVHTFLNLGETALGPETIVDITADQYGGPRMYVGPLTEPWSKAQDWL